MSKESFMMHELPGITSVNVESLKGPLPKDVIILHIVKMLNLEGKKSSFLYRWYAVNGSKSRQKEESLTIKECISDAQRYFGDNYFIWDESMKEGW